MSELIVKHSFSFNIQSENWPPQPWPWNTTTTTKKMRPNKLYFSVSVVPVAPAWSKQYPKPLTQVSNPRLVGPRILKDGSEGVDVSLDLYGKAERPGFVQTTISDALNAVWSYLCDYRYDRAELAESYHV